MPGVPAPVSGRMINTRLQSATWLTAAGGPRIISRRRSNSVAFGAKRTFSQPRLPNRIYEECHTGLAHRRRQCFPCPDQLADGSDLHLAHDIAAVQLDGDFTDAEVERDLLVDAPTRDIAQNLDARVASAS